MSSIFKAKDKSSKKGTPRSRRLTCICNIIALNKIIKKLGELNLDSRISFVDCKKEFNLENHTRK
jgi:hypothetical protein